MPLVTVLDRSRDFQRSRKATDLSNIVTETCRPKKPVSFKNTQALPQAVSQCSGIMAGTPRESRCHLHFTSPAVSNASRILPTSTTKELPVSDLKFTQALAENWLFNHSWYGVNKWLISEAADIVWFIYIYDYCWNYAVLLLLFSKT